MLNIIVLFLKEVFDEEFVFEIDLIKVFQEETKCKSPILIWLDVYSKIEFLQKINKKFLKINKGTRKHFEHLYSL